MAFIQNNNNYNQANNGGEPQQKTNFPIGKVFGNDGTIEIRCWKSNNNAVYTNIIIRQQTGKDPQGHTLYEGGLIKDIPNVLFRVDSARALYEYLITKNPATVNLQDYSAPGYPDSKISFQGSETGVKITITNPKGTRSFTLGATPVGGENVNANWKNFISQFKRAIDAGIFVKTAPELGSSNEEEPF